MAGGHLLVLRENGELVMASANSKAFKPVAQARIQMEWCARILPLRMGYYLRGTKKLWWRFGSAVNP